MDEDLQQILTQYIKSESIIKCLALGGFTTCKVFMDLNKEDVIKELEQFIRQTCILMTNKAEIESYLGPIFSHHPEKFRFPAGIVIALLKAANYLTDRQIKQDGCTQTDVTLPPCTQFSEPLTTAALLSALQNNVNFSLCKLDSQQGNDDHSRTDSTETSPLTSLFSSAFNNTLTSPNNLSHVIQPPSVPEPIVGYTRSEENIDLEKLKQMATANCTRLISRQFKNANLSPGQDFDIEMELAVTKEGQKRVTGIYYCHLCREKRERISAVRFSIARNKYPVMSNVVSHLKTHLSYVPSSHSSQNAHVLLTTNSTSYDLPPLKRPAFDQDLSQPHIHSICSMGSHGPINLTHDQSWSNGGHSLKREPDAIFNE